MHSNDFYAMFGIDKQCEELLKLFNANHIYQIFLNEILITGANFSKHISESPNLRISDFIFVILVKLSRFINGLSWRSRKSQKTFK